MTLHDVYTRTQQICNVAEKVQEANYDTSEDFGEQAARLAEIIEIASELEPLYADLAAVLTDED